MSGDEFWLGLDDDDPVPMPVPVWPPPTLGEIRRDAKQAKRLRAQAWALAEVQINAEMRQPYAHVMALPGLTQPQTRAILSDAFRRVAMAVYDEHAAVEAHRRRNAPAAHSAAVMVKQEKRWGAEVRALLQKHPTWGAAKLAKLLAGENGGTWKVPAPPEKHETSTFGRFVSQVKAERK